MSLFQELSVTLYVSWYTFFILFTNAHPNHYNDFTILSTRISLSHTVTLEALSETKHLNRKNVETHWNENKLKKTMMQKYNVSVFSCSPFSSTIGVSVCRLHCFGMFELRIKAKMWVYPHNQHERYSNLKPILLL